MLLDEETERNISEEISKLEAKIFPDPLVLSFFLNEAFMALHEFPLTWQRYLRENYGDSDFLKRILVISRSSLSDGFISEDDIKIETDLIGFCRV